MSGKGEEFTVSSNEGVHPDQLLNDIYARVRGKARDSTADSNVVLLSYLSHAHEPHLRETTHSSDSIQNLASSLQRPNLPHNPHRKPKRHSQNVRVKTELDEMESVSEVEWLRRENESLRERVARYEKRVVALEGFECEAEYMRKLVLIQDSEIGKLRRLLKAARQAQIAHDEQNHHSQAGSLALKERRTNDPILITDAAEEPDKRKKCAHKRAEGLHARTESTEDAACPKPKSFLSKSREDTRKPTKRKDKNVCR